MSTGWRQRLALATAIVHKPRLLFLDEPTSGVDPNARRAFWDLIYELVADGVTALVTTHYMDEAEYCGRVGIMRAGCLLALDTPSNLKTNALPGIAWDIHLQQSISVSEKGQLLLRSLERLQVCPFVLRAGLVSDHLRAITPEDIDCNVLLGYLSDSGISEVRIEAIAPSLEDVFLALAAVE
jgi:ABC-2 type transport system ATP-binding protein